MGYYINNTSKGVALSAKNKADYLILDGAKEVTPNFQPNLICVVENPHFDAEAYCFDQREFELFTYKDDPRPKRWLTHPLAAELSGYK